MSPDPVTPDDIVGEISEWEKAQRQQVSEQQAAFDAAVEQWRGKHIFSLRQLAQLPPQSPLIHGNILFKRTTCWIAGQPGTYKSFVALDWAMCIATGRQWLGRDVEQGRVLYIAGEGAAGMWVRARAWLRRHNLDLDATDDAIEFMGPEDLMDEQTRAMLSHLATNGFWSLLVVDTQARALPGVNENAKEELDPFIRFVTHLAAERGTTVLTVHHASLGGNPLRGSGSILGAADSVFVLTREEDVQLEVELKIHKHKETESGEVLPLTMVEERWEPGPGGGSLVVDHGISREDLRSVGLGKPDERTMRHLEAVMLELLERVGDGVYTRNMLVHETADEAARKHLRVAMRDVYEAANRAVLGGLIVLPTGGKAIVTQSGVARLAWIRQYPPSPPASTV